MKEPAAPTMSSTDIDVSVLTPSYGYGRYISNALDSAMGARSLRIEHIIQDACSEDDTPEVLESARDRYGDAIKWAIEPDKGQSDALNKAFSVADGRWIGWLNADEFYLPGGLDELVAAGDRTGADVVYGDAVFVDAEGRLMRLKPQHRFNEFILRNYGVFISTCATIFRRSALWPDPWDIHLRLLMDHDIYLKLAHRSADFAYVPYPVAAFRVHSERVSAEPDAFGGDYAVVQGRHGRGGSLAKAAAWFLHAIYKATSGGYRRQRCANALVGAPMTWTDPGDDQRGIERLLRACYGR
jgi:glycosyltransferase involved in cell wall biosynthesis